MTSHRYNMHLNTQLDIQKLRMENEMLRVENEKLKKKTCEKTEEEKEKARVRSAKARETRLRFLEREKVALAQLRRNEAARIREEKRLEEERLERTFGRRMSRFMDGVSKCFGARQEQVVYAYEVIQDQEPVVAVVVESK